MKKITFIIAIIFTLFIISESASTIYEHNIFKTAEGNIDITFIGHASLMITFNGKVIHVDPFSKMADYSEFKKADLILITHHHRDHLDPSALKLISKTGTKIVASQKCAKELKNPIIMNNGDVKSVEGFKIEAVPAYNIVHKRKSGEAYHVKGEGNGYVISISDKRIYIAGDTENIPEMKELKNIDIAFLPMNLPYTMTPEMTANAALMFRPKILYPYHYGKTDRNILVNLLKKEKGIEVRLAEFYPKNREKK